MQINTYNKAPSRKLYNNDAQVNLSKRIYEPQVITNIPMSVQNQLNFHCRSCIVKYENGKAVIYAGNRRIYGKDAKRIVKGLNKASLKRYT